MLVIRGDTRVADIYLTEFMRLFNHYRLRGRAQPRADRARAGPGRHAEPSAASSTCATTTAGRAPFFVAGSPEAKERLLFA